LIWRSLDPTATVRSREDEEAHVKGMKDGFSRLFFGGRPYESLDRDQREKVDIRVVESQVNENEMKLVKELRRGINLRADDTTV